MAMAHMRPETFAEPERFLPERFMNRRYSPFEFFPWGGGAHRCLAANFATLELRAVLATLLLRFRLRSLQRGPIRIVRHSATMWPRCGLPAIYEGRR
jgi:cytochrome P450